MKGLIKSLIFGICSFLLFSGTARAETFYEGDYIVGEYINKVIDGKTYYMTMQYIEDRNNNIVYCLEPFTKFVDGKSYTQYDGELTGYKDLTSEQKRKISLIIYYGYGYGNRTSSKWYVITQFLVWKVVDGNANIYFTDTLNGKKITKYSTESNEILADVKNHDAVPVFVKEYSIDYDRSFSISGISDKYEIVSSDYEYEAGDDIYILKNIRNNGVLNIRRISNYYKNKVMIFDSNNSQDVIRPGNVVNPVLSLVFKVKKGDITLDIRDDDSVYTVESDFTNTCYEISKGGIIIDNVCTGDKSLVYKTDYLSYGEYKIKQTSVGMGYLPDVNVYNVKIDSDSVNPTIILYNKLLKNNIEIIKYFCKEEECNYEKDALFEIYDKNKKLVNVLTTNKNGYSDITLGYGAYLIKQVKGLNDYTLAAEYNEKIVDESSDHLRKLYNYYIVEEVIPEEKEEMNEAVEEKEEEKGEVKGEELIIPNSIDNISIPDTKTDNFLLILINYLCSIFEGIFAFLE